MAREFRQNFQYRLAKAFKEAEITKAELSRLTDVDRSTITQLLKKDNMRLPRADTVAALAAGLNTTSDWLLGLTNEKASKSNIVQEILSIKKADKYSPVEQTLLRWHQKYYNDKIRYVASTIPDQLKTLSTIGFEHKHFYTSEQVRQLAISEERQKYTSMHQRDFEVCASLELVELFIKGHGVWQGMPRKDRIEQIEYMIEKIDEHYPDYRLYLYDSLKCLSPQITIFGRMRAAIGVGYMYFAYNTPDHIEALIQHFNTLIKEAPVKAHEIISYLEDNLKKM